MTNGDEFAGGLLRGVQSEGKFRERVLAHLGFLLTSKDIPAYIKAIIGLALIDVLAISFVFAIFLIHAATYLLKEDADQDFQPLLYGVAIALMMIIMLGIAFVLILKAGEMEARFRLQDSLSRTYKAKYASA